MKFKPLKDIVSAIHRKKYSGIIIAVISILIIIPLSLTESFQSIELKLFDLRFKLKPSIAEWDKLYFVDIDDASISQLGQYPWTRNVYAKGLYTLSQVKTEIAAFDIMFPDKAPILVNQDLYNQLIMNYFDTGGIELESLYNIITNHDNIFAESLTANKHAILSYTFALDKLSNDNLALQQSDEYKEYINIFNSKTSIQIPENEIQEFSGMVDDSIFGIVYPIPEFITSAESFGFVNRYTDIDGTIRKVQLVEAYNNRLYFNLAVMMLIKDLKITLNDVEVIPGKEILLKNIIHPLKKDITEIRIPIDKEGMIFVNWAGPGPRQNSFHILPFSALLEYENFTETSDSILNEIGEKSVISRKNKLLTDIDNLQKKMYVTENPDELNTLNSQLNNYLDELHKIKTDLTDELKSTISKLEQDYKKNPDDNKKNQIEILNQKFKVLNLIVQVENLRNKVTITGLTATGSTDIASIPINNEYPGVGTYLNTINTVIQGKYIRQIPALFSWLIMALICIATGMILQRQSARRALFTGVASFILLNAGAALLFMFGNIWVNQLGTNLAFLFPGVSIIASKLLSEESQRKYIKGAFSQFLSAEYINEIILNPDLLKLGGENRQITTFFSDVAGFSTLSEGLTATELVRRLNEYLSEMTDIIMFHGGYVDKYEGDAIMAFYGAPIPHPDHELRACHAAIDMKKKLRDLQDKWVKEGEQPLYVRMGMNTGDAVIGNMGSENKKNYTAMGDSVNLASRLEGANKFYSTKAMISENTYKAVRKQIEARKLDTIRVVGKTEPTVIYELLGEKDSLPQKMYDCIEQYNKGLQMFDERQWKKARRFFAAAVKIIPDDGPSLKYIERCDEFMKKPPSKKWDGVYSLKSK
ncbi:MAG: CHASE2 domain-containing protein [Spirochaetes bacterium]|nr:CHASE2 domain-containing protein [Spirochaetota bacterium]